MSAQNHIINATPTQTSSYADAQEAVEGGKKSVDVGARLNNSDVYISDLIFASHLGLSYGKRIIEHRPRSLAQSSKRALRGATGSKI